MPKAKCKEIFNAIRNLQNMQTKYIYPNLSESLADEILTPIHKAESLLVNTYIETISAGQLDFNTDFDFQIKHIGFACDQINDLFWGITNLSHKQVYSAIAEIVEKAREHKYG